MRAITLAQVLLRLLGVFFFVSALSAVGSVLLLLPAFSDPLSRSGLRSGARIAALFITRPPLLGRRGVASAWNAMRGRDEEEKTQT